MNKNIELEIRSTGIYTNQSKIPFAPVQITARSISKIGTRVNLVRFEVCALELNEALANAGKRARVTVDAKLVP